MVSSHIKRTHLSCNFLGGIILQVFINERIGYVNVWRTENKRSKLIGQPKPCFSSSLHYKVSRAVNNANDEKMRYLIYWRRNNQSGEAIHLHSSDFDRSCTVIFDKQCTSYFCYVTICFRCVFFLPYHRLKAQWLAISSVCKIFIYSSDDLD